MRIHTLRGTWTIDMDSMKVYDAQGVVRELWKIPSPVAGDRCQIETGDGVFSTEPVTEVSW